jgi:hypothetical protein
MEDLRSLWFNGKFKDVVAGLQFDYFEKGI